MPTWGLRYVKRLLCWRFATADALQGSSPDQLKAACSSHCCAPAERIPPSGTTFQPVAVTRLLASSVKPIGSARHSPASDGMLKPRMHKLCARRHGPAVQKDYDHFRETADTHAWMAGPLQRTVQVDRSQCTSHRLAHVYESMRADTALHAIFLCSLKPLI